MIEAIDNRIVVIDTDDNMIEIPEITVLYQSMKIILGDVTIDKTIIEPT